MKIADYENLIGNLPYKNQSFDIKKDIWKSESQIELLDSLFDTNDLLIINRNDLFNLKNDLDSFIVKTLMWGYPTKGRGKNIDKLLKKQNFSILKETLKDYRDNDISLSKLQADIKNIEGLGLSTMSKFTCFLNAKIEGFSSVILDLQIIDCINLGRFEELNNLKGIRYDNATKKYPEYLKVINELATDLNVKADQIEIFLFIFGKNLSEIN